MPSGTLPLSVAFVLHVGVLTRTCSTFYPFFDEPTVRLLGVEAGGDGIDTDRHSATLAKGTIGVLHGVRTYILQSKNGQILGTHSISAGLDYPGVGPELGAAKERGRLEVVVADDVEALKGFRMCTELEGIIPALETAHAIWGTAELAKTMPKDSDIVMVRSTTSYLPGSLRSFFLSSACPAEETRTWNRSASSYPSMLIDWAGT